MSYWKLVCKDCKKTAPFVSDSDHELLHPSASSEYCPCCGAVTDCGGQRRAAEAIEAFHQMHEGHKLQAVEV